MGEQEQRSFVARRGTFERGGGARKFNKLEALKIFKIKPQEYHQIALEERGIDYFKELVSKYDTWAEAKSRLDISEIKNILKLNESDLKEVFKSDLKAYEKEQEQIIKQHKPQVKFNFESEKSEVKTIEGLEKVILNNFPSVWFETKACLSLFATMSQENLNGCPSLNLVGNPSGEKTTVLSFFYDHDLSYLSDDFTPKAFVSHSTNVKKDELEGIDLLPKLKNKVLISPELAPLFEAPKDKLLENFSILTRVLDGEGLNRDSGAHGHRGYSGDYKFGWLGATTPLKAAVWNVMGKIGNRLFFLNMREKNRTTRDYVGMFTEKAYEKKVKICRGAVKSFLQNHFKNNNVRSIDWDAEQDIFVLQEIIKYAQLLSKLRGTLMLWKAEGETYQHSFPLVEEPPRAINALYNFAKGHALINGRTFLKNDDLEIVRSIAFSSMPHDRYQFLKLLIEHEGRLSTANIEKELSCSSDTARRTMEIFKVLGVVSLKKLDSYGGRPMYYVEIMPEFKELLQPTQGLISAENEKPHQIRGVYDDISAQKIVELEKNRQKNTHAHPPDVAEKGKPQEINPVCQGCGAPNAMFNVSNKRLCKECAYK